MTVGSGIAPDLLTLSPGDVNSWRKALAGFHKHGLGTLVIYRRWGVSPRPENVASFCRSRVNYGIGAGRGKSRNMARRRMKG